MEVSPVGINYFLFKVNKQFAKLALENDIWKDLYLLDFQNQNRNLKVKSWYTMYKRRLTALHGEKGKWVVRKHGIENCAMEFECPLMWENLTTTGDNNRTRACDKCHKTVYKGKYYDLLFVEIVF